MIRIPPYLKPGDTIGIVAPAGFMPFEKIESCINMLQDWGYNIQLGATTHSGSENYFSGTDEERLNDLQAMLDDKNVKAILCARGGYGLSRIVDQLSFKKFRKNPKWLIGYSDVTVLHAHLYSNYKFASLHAPMAAAFNGIAIDDKYIASIKDALEGRPARYTCAGHPFNKEGRVEGQLVGGNLTLLVHMIGTASDLSTKNKILFLEDVGEYLYNIDRMFVHLKRAGKLEKPAGLIIGGFTDVKDTERPFGKTAYESIRDNLADVDCPVCFGFPVSHSNENYALKMGSDYELDIKAGGVSLNET